MACANKSHNKAIKSQAKRRLLGQPTLRFFCVGAALKLTQKKLRIVCPLWRRYGNKI